MTNHDMNGYDFIEGDKFSGVVPAFIQKYSASTVGSSTQIVKEFGTEAKGVDPIEVIDFN